eukprot:g2132.t1
MASVLVGNRRTTIIDESKSQIDSIYLSETSQLLAVSLSNIFADTWSGKLKVFRANAQHVYSEIESVDLIGGNSASVIFLKTLKSKAPELLLTASDSGDIYIWNCEDNGSNLSYIKHFVAHERVVSCLCPCKSRPLSFYSSSYDFFVNFWTEDRLVRQFQGHAGPVTCVTCCSGDSTLNDSNSGNLCLSGGLDNCAFIWDLRASDPVTCFKADANVNALNWNSDISENIILLGDGDGQVSMYDIRYPFKALYEMDKRKGNINSITSFFSENNKQLNYVIGSDDTTCSIISGNMDVDKELENGMNNDDDDDLMFANVQNISSPYRINMTSNYQLNDHKDYVRAIKWNKQSNMLLTGGWDGCLYSYAL